MEKTILYIVFAVLWLVYNIYTGIQKRKNLQKKADPVQKPLSERTEREIFPSPKKGNAPKRKVTETKVPSTSQEVFVDEAAYSSEIESEEALYQKPGWKSGNSTVERKQTSGPETAHSEEEEPLLTEVDLRQAIIYSEIINKPKYQQ